MATVANDENVRTGVRDVCVGVTCLVFVYG